MSAPPPVAVEGPLLRVERLRAWFGREPRVVRAVDGVNLTLARGETLGLVGESGCGKSTLARCMLRLNPVTSGSIRFDGLDITHLRGAALRRLRPRMQMVFQDPVESLNPRLTLARIIGESLIVHRRTASWNEARRQAGEWLTRVGLQAGDLDAYPHQFSGGQRQRVGIARALVLRPELLVCDEPVSALDVSIRSQILNLLMELQRELHLACLMIAHDLAVVRRVCDRVAVMYLGRIVEQGPAAELFSRPRHPYTRALLAAAPDVHRPATEVRTLPLLGEPPSPLNPPAGCAFHPRCPHAEPRCRAERPELRPVEGVGGTVAACHFFERLPAAGGRTAVRGHCNQPRP